MYKFCSIGQVHPEKILRKIFSPSGFSCESLSWLINDVWKRSTQSSEESHEVRASMIIFILQVRKLRTETVRSCPKPHSWHGWLWHTLIHCGLVHSGTELHSISAIQWMEAASRTVWSSSFLLCEESANHRISNTRSNSFVNIPLCPHTGLPPTLRCPVIKPVGVDCVNQFLTPCSLSSHY